MKVSAADAGGEATSAPAFGQHTYFSLPLIGLIHLDFAVQPVPVGANLLGRTGWGELVGANRLGRNLCNIDHASKTSPPGEGGRQWIPGIGISPAG